MSPVAIPADRRFRRAHVRPGGRRDRWRRQVARTLKVSALALLVALALYHGPDMVAGARILQISRIIVRGNQHVSAAQVLESLEGLQGENIVWADLEEWRRRVLTSPWVADVFFRRALPSTVEVTVREREPIAVGRFGGSLYLIDARGIVIDEFGPQHVSLDLPLVDGLGDSARASAAPDEARAELAARLILSFKTKPEVARRVSQINVTNPHNAGVILNGDGAVLYVGEDRFLARVEAYLGLATALHEQVNDIDYVDLRFDDRIYVRPAGKAAPASASRASMKSQPAGTKGGRQARDASTGTGRQR